MGRLTFPGRLAVQQRVLPPYRAVFFDALAEVCTGGMGVFAGNARADEMIAAGETLVADHTLADNLHLLSGPVYLCHQPGLTTWLADEDPDVLILEANPRYLATPSALRWMRRRGRPVIGWGLGAAAISRPLAGLRRSIRGSFLSQFDALIAYSNRGAAEYAALGFPAEKVFVAPNAAAPRPVHPLPERPAGFSGRPVVIFVGRLQARKRIDDLLHACAALPAAVQPRLVVIGDGPERAALEAIAQHVYPLAEFPGAVHGAGLGPYFLAADLFVLPGTGGLAVQEAMSYGLPVVMGRGDGTNDDLVRPQNGWQLAAEGPGALAEVLSEALADSSHLRTMGAESYRIVSEEVNIEMMVAAFVGVLNHVK